MSGVATATETRDESGSKPGAISVVSDFAEKTAKAVTVFMGTIYVIGYVIVATRLAEYDVPVNRLVDAQYFVAGLLPGLLLWLTVFVFVSAFRYDSHERGGDPGRLLSGLSWAVFVLYVVLLLVELFIVPRSEGWGVFVRSLVNTSYVAGKFVLGELALWFLIVGVRTGYFSRLRKAFKATREDSPVWFFVLFSFVLGVIALWQIPKVGWNVYNGLPQAYGGGKPLRIELYVDGNKVATELLDAESANERTSTLRTIPLNLIMRTSTEYIVYPLKGNTRGAYVLKADVVHGEHIIVDSSD